MFFRQIRRNAARNRRGNSLYFASLVVAIVASYVLLSLGKHDVIQFLRTTESDAVQKLLSLLPLIYGVALFFLFFLVFFACRYQASARRREFGLYLMMGMRKRQLFSLLFGETLPNSLVALVIGIPVALLLTEIVSLATARFIGLGIIGHTFTFSVSAIFWTAGGFLVVQLISLAIICTRLAKAEPADLLRADSTSLQVVPKKSGSIAVFAAGCVVLIWAWIMALNWLNTSWGSDAELIGATIVMIACWLAGTFLLYAGLGGLLGRRLQRRRATAHGLSTFTSRQVQESVLSQHTVMAVSSLLLTGALACVSYGIAGSQSRATGERSVDASVFGTPEEIQAVLAKDDVQQMVQESWPMYVSMMKGKYLSDGTDALDLSDWNSALERASTAREMSGNTGISYVIRLDSYNAVRAALGEEPLVLRDHQVALYSALQDTVDGDVRREALTKGVSLGINGESYQLLRELYGGTIIADRALTLSAALIVPENLYAELAASTDAYCVNLRLADSVVESLGLMQAEQQLDSLLGSSGLEMTSYLASIGRHLFYVVAASYLTIYLGILLWLVANTVIGLKFLINQRETRHRYDILAMLGAKRQDVQGSVKHQITVFFLLVLVPALISSVALVVAMFANFGGMPEGAQASTVIGLVAAAFVVFVLCEVGYIAIVKHQGVSELDRAGFALRR